MKQACLPFVVLLFLCITTTYAQTRIIVYPNTTQHPPKRISTVGQKHRPFLGTGQSALKIGLSAVFRADYGISLEKKLARKWSGEVTAGLTHYDRVKEALDFFTFHPSNIVHAKRSYNFGPSLKLAGRYYLETGDDEISGPYFSVEGMFRRYNYTVQNNYTSPSQAREHSDQREIRALYGFQNNDFRDAAFYDYSIGFGYRFHQRTYLGYGNLHDFSSQHMVTSCKNYLVFVINFRMGFMLH